MGTRAGTRKDEALIELEVTAVRSTRRYDRGFHADAVEEVTTRSSTALDVGRDSRLGKLKQKRAASAAGWWLLPARRVEGWAE